MHTAEDIPTTAADISLEEQLAANADDAPLPPVPEKGKRLGLTVGRLRAIDTKLASGLADLAKASELLGELMNGRENKSSEKVDLLRAIESRTNQLGGPVVQTQQQVKDLIELVLDDD